MAGCIRMKNTNISCDETPVLDLDDDVAGKGHSLLLAAGKL